MDRRVFIRQTAVAALGGLVAFDLSKASAKSEMAFAGKGEISPRAITMWDFSWLERRWAGAGYETGTKYWTSSRNGGIMRYVLMLILI